MALKYMVIDDSLFVRELLKSAVNRFGLNYVGEADSCLNAESTIDDFAPDIIFIDLVLPQKSGLQFIAELREKFAQKITLVACSSLDSDDIRNRVMVAGADYFISKPFTLESVEETIRAISGREVKYG